LPVDPFPQYSGPVSIIVRPITTKTQHGLGPGQGAQCALLLFSVTHGCLPAHAVNTTRKTTQSFFLLPRPPIFPREGFHPAVSVLWHSVSGINAFLLVATQCRGFIGGMNLCIIADSKLCADNPRHAPGHFLSEIPEAQLGKGQSFAPPRCIPSRVPPAAPDFAAAGPLRLRKGKPETVPVFAPSELRRGKPVSAPSGLGGVVAFRSWEVRP